ncbi:hypothetical protein GOP47_0008280 [Adiantum capillus-veneris]|uniref:Cytochrome b5 heme-binding domain-containing protein n=1 Tax=Adiantum capillus-veneris TaxID=13818 RepID=A0A9D4UXZ2_ADICA|nr:hypothetical protein GOP47_0008280 [Adiantum capillus-veneris]
MSNFINFAQVSEHSTSEKCWILISGKVYDVTRFLEEHPGGDDVILSATGKDATDDFEDVGHSETARGMLKDYYIGDIDASTIPKTTAYKAPKQPKYNQDKSAQFVGKILQLVLPLAIFAGAVAMHFYSKSNA